MSVFNQTFENLLKDKYVTVDSLGRLKEFLDLLEEKGARYRITKSFNWWHDTIEYLVEILD